MVFITKSMEGEISFRQKDLITKLQQLIIFLLIFLLDDRSYEQQLSLLDINVYSTLFFYL